MFLHFSFLRSYTLLVQPIWTKFPRFKAIFWVALPKNVKFGFYCSDELGQNPRSIEHNVGVPTKLVTVWSSHVLSNRFRAGTLGPLEGAVPRGHCIYLNTSAYFWECGRWKGFCSYLYPICALLVTVALFLNTGIMALKHLQALAIAPYFMDMIFIRMQGYSNVRQPHK
jgi:hypothetical protein